MHTVYEEVRRDAEQLSVAVTGSELVGLVPLTSILEAAEYYIKKEKPTKPPYYELPDFGPPYRDDFVIRNQIHGTFQKTTAKPKKQTNKFNAHPYVPSYHQPAAKGKYEEEERHYAPIQNLNTSKFLSHEFCIALFNSVRFRLY